MHATSRPMGSWRHRMAAGRRSRSACGWATAITRTLDRRKPAISLTAAAPLWRAFMREYTNGWPVTQFVATEGRGQGDHRCLVGRQAGAVDEGRRPRWFIDGTQPGARKAVDPDGLLYSQILRRLSRGPPQGRARAERLGLERRRLDAPGTTAVRGVTGPLDSRTAYFWKQSSWGGSLAGACAPVRVRADGDHGGKGHDGGKPEARQEAARTRARPTAPIATPVP